MCMKYLKIIAIAGLLVNLAAYGASTDSVSSTLKVLDAATMAINGAAERLRVARKAMVGTLEDHARALALGDGALEAWSNAAEAARKTLAQERANFIRATQEYQRAMANYNRSHEA